MSIKITSLILFATASVVFSCCNSKHTKNSFDYESYEYVRGFEGEQSDKETDELYYFRFTFEGVKHEFSMATAMYDTEKEAFIITATSLDVDEIGDSIIISFPHQLSKKYFLDREKNASLYFRCGYKRYRTDRFYLIVKKDAANTELIKGRFSGVLFDTTTNYPVEIREGRFSLFIPN